MRKFIVCPRCDGEGTHTNPSIDGNGLSSEDFDQMGEGFREDYFSGVYDVTCYECHGQRVVKAQEAKTQEELEQESWNRELAAERESCNREWAAERRMESMMLGEY